MSGWSTLQLTEFFSAITRAGDLTSAARIAVQRAAEATDASVAAVVCGDAVPASVGLGRSPDPSLFTSTDISGFPGIGPMHVTVHALDRGIGERLIVARTDEPFAAEERQMLQGMARVLGLALRSLRTLESERQLAESRLVLLEALERRERLLETLLRVQRSANLRTPIGEVLGSITAGAASLLAGSAVALVLHSPAGLTVRSLSGSSPHEPLIDAAQRAITAGRPVTGPDLIAAPVHVGHEIAGGFVITGPGGDIRESERRDVLAAFAEQASLALTGADAHHDPLTRLPNRTLFLQRVEQVVAAGHPAALLYLDLDLFKQVNDTLGHSAGDELLLGVADRLRGVVRDSDMPARLGGDEFAVLLDPADGARDLAERVIDAIARPFEIGGRSVRTRVSVGIAYTGGGCTAQGLVEDADLAMYRAKKTMPGTCREFDPAMRAELLAAAHP
ncbi:diguanylate cyclase domain-containing protein [Actinoplanes sp. GCM10030250]|uniref:diguanylate cyclase domain-containing protein n=1 Tax=Actinoplanes sp. GCM10030250 TaxID=3273376 RepID=UPI00361D6574